MEPVNILVILSLAEFSIAEKGECLRRIDAVSPRIKMRDISDLVIAEQRGDLAAKEQLDALLAEAEVVYGFTLPQNIIARAPRLKWVEMIPAGVERFLDADMVKSPVIMTNGRGLAAISISESILGFMLMFVKRAPFCFQLKQNRQWDLFPAEGLRSKTVGIVGLGNIGQEVARLAKAFGMRVIAEDVNPVVRPKHVDISVTPEQLPELLSDSDFVVLTLPLTSETYKLIGEEELRTMKSTAYLINVARGKLVDEEALIRALDEHWIAGAGLDVFAIEPLPADSRLWEFPNVIFSPHVAGHIINDTRIIELFRKNLRRYLQGKKLLNVVDKKKEF